jgi:hypothetical protein
VGAAGRRAADVARSWSQSPGGVFRRAGAGPRPGRSEQSNNLVGVLQFKANTPSLTRSETANPALPTTERLTAWWLLLPRPAQWAVEQIASLGLQKLVEFLWQMLF